MADNQDMESLWNDAEELWDDAEAITTEGRSPLEKLVYGDPEKAAEFQRGVEERYGNIDVPVMPHMQPTRKDVLNTVGMMGGGYLAGPPGSAFGYTISNHINRMLDGERTGADTAAKDLAVGTAYEYIPGAVARGAGKIVAPKWLQNRLAQFSLSPSPTKGVRHSKQVTSTQIDKDLTVTEDGLAKAWEKIKGNTKKVAEEAAAMEARGELIDPMDIYAPMLRFKDKVADMPPTSATKDTIAHIDDFIATWMAKYGAGPMKPTEAVSIKKAADQYLSTFYRRLEKGASDLATPLDKSLMGKGSDGIRNALNKNPVMRRANRETHQLLNWLQDAERRVVSQRNKSLVPFGTAETIGVSKSLGGNVPIATLAVGGRALLNLPSVASKNALLLKRLGSAAQGFRMPGAVPYNLNSILQRSMGEEEER